MCIFMSMKCKEIQKALNLCICRVTIVLLDRRYHFIRRQWNCHYVQRNYVYPCRTCWPSIIRLCCVSGTIMFSLLFILIIHGVIDIQGTVRNIWHLYLVTAFFGHWKCVRKDQYNLKNMAIWYRDKKGMHNIESYSVYLL